MNWSMQNIVVKILGCSECNTDDINEWLHFNLESLDFKFWAMINYPKYNERISAGRHRRWHFSSTYEGIGLTMPERWYPWRQLLVLELSKMDGMTTSCHQVYTGPRCIQMKFRDKTTLLEMFN